MCFRCVFKVTVCTELKIAIKARASVSNRVQEVEEEEGEGEVSCGCVASHIIEVIVGEYTSD